MSSAEPPGSLVHMVMRNDVAKLRDAVRSKTHLLSQAVFGMEYV